LDIVGGVRWIVETESLITDCRRGGAKGVPGKNIRQVHGKPLIAYTIETAKRFAENKEVTLSLSTDSQDIKDTAASFGLETSYMRPAVLGGDKIGKIDVVRDILLFEEERNKKRFDLILDLDITSPLRQVWQLEAALSQLLADPEALNLFSVSPARKNPYFNMVEQKESGYYDLVKKA